VPLTPWPRAKPVMLESAIGLNPAGELG
jgi:hypothetical protein